MKLSKNVLSDIRKRANGMKVSDEELYTSQAFQKYLQNTADSVLKRKLKNSVTVCPLYMPEDDLTACTDSDKIVINAGNSVAAHYSEQEARFLTVLGMLFHECAHCLYLDFNLENQAFGVVEAGAFWPEPPVPTNKEETETVQELNEVMHDPERRRILLKIIQELSNIIADAHDEAAICSDYGALVGRGIRLAADSLAAQSLALEDMEKEDRPTLSILYSLILQYIRYDRLIVLDEQSLKKETAKAVLDMRQLLIESRQTNSAAEKFRYINQILVRMWPAIKDELENPQSGGSGGNQQSQNNDSNSGSQDGSNGGNSNDSQQTSGSSGGSSSQQDSGNADSGGSPQQGSGSQGGAPNQQTPGQQADAVQRVLDMLSQASRDAGQSGAGNAPTGRNTADSAQNANAAAQPNGTEDSQAGSEALRTLTQSIAMGKAEREVEQEAAKALKQDLKGMNLSGSEKRKLQVVRSLDYSDSMVRNYETAYANVKVYSKALQRKMRNILRDLNDEDLIRTGYGPIICAEESYRRDGRYFYKKKLPEDLPNMAVGLLIDHSGSMSSYGRLGACVQAAVLLDDFASGLDVPIMIAGHHSNGSTVKLHVYVPFERSSKLDRYRLMNMRPYDCNRDGMALDAMAKLMMKRPEDIKLLFILSDGLPSDYRSRAEGAEDLQAVCRYAEKHGIQIIAGGIGEDQESLKKIYGTRFLDIKNLSELPKTLTGIVKKKLTR